MTPQHHGEPPFLASLVPAEILAPADRFARARYIATLDPEADCEQIGFLLASCEFPWDTTRALELALLRTFAVAKGTPLLVETDELIRRTQKRYDDTALILAEIQENGVDHPRGRAALRRMNQQHGRYAIAQDEYLYTLSTFVFEPIRWNARFGWRRLSAGERLATFHVWRRIGARMGIRHIPADYAELERFNVEFERAHFRYSEHNEALATATRNLMLGWFLPRPLWPVAAPLMHALLDAPMLQAVGFDPAPAPVRRLVLGGMAMRRWVLRRLPPRRRPRLLTRQRHRSYPRGYRIEELGADR
ncbi:oxygenase MpaB family protein [uncultured Thiohalocapsa sp.]|uniref:oxygenase MpaB family protein n=1 Tax=uncultured Thiohalocapsa sp. TaxID=768990 RepID=UPI0025D4246A|nr:oxygenase MpaB family protein [uncultured Thiohalocapsa sp.]